MQAHPNAQLKSDSLRLKFIHRTGQYTLDTLTANSTIEDLLQAITTILGIPRTELVLFCGFPRQKIVCTDAHLSKRLREIPLFSGDTVTVDTKVASPVKVDIMDQKALINTTESNTQQSLIPRIVRLQAPSDNSCLFTSLIFSVQNADGHLPIGTPVVTNNEAVKQMRELISAVVQSDPERYSEAVLGMPNEEYSQKIRQPDRWGGGIEVSILSQLHEVEICIVDIESGRIDRFGEDRNYSKRILLLYDGIHYDPLAQERPGTGCLVSVFRSTDDAILIEAQKLASEARAQWAFTDTSSFSLLCRQCNMPLVGQAEAQKHAEATGHTQYREVGR